MSMSIEQTFTLADDDIRAAVAEYLSKKFDLPIGPEHVKVVIDGGSPGFNQFDAGRAPSVKISATLSRDG